MSIVEMPELVLEKIIGFADFKDVLTLRQVCRSFRNFVDDIRDSKLLDSKFETIHIFSTKHDNKINFNFFWDFDRRTSNFEYSAMNNSRVFNRTTTAIFENSNIVDVAIRDLELMLKFQKTILNQFYLYFDDFRIQKDSSIHSLSMKLINMFNVSGRKIKTRQLGIETYDKSHVIPMLQLADPETLEHLSLSLWGEEAKIEIDEIAKTEQWKKAKTLRCGSYWPNLNVENICHFSKISIRIDSITARDLNSLKEAFISSSNFKNFKECILALKNFNEQEELSNIWGPAFHFQLRNIWYFGIKDSEEKVLRIQICGNIIFFNPHFREYVLNGAIIHDYNEN